MSAYLVFGPHTCNICKQEYDIVFADPEVCSLKNINPEFATFDMCEDCGIEEARKKLNPEN